MNAPDMPLLLFPESQGQTSLQVPLHSLSHFAKIFPPDLVVASLACCDLEFSHSASVNSTTHSRKTYSHFTASTTTVLLRLAYLDPEFVNRLPLCEGAHITDSLCEFRYRQVNQIAVQNWQ